jgi:hypothetical protein
MNGSTFDPTIAPTRSHILATADLAAPSKAIKVEALAMNGSTFDPTIAPTRSHIPATADLAAPSKAFKIEALEMTGSTFDPTIAATRSHILSAVGLSACASIVETPDPKRKSEGMWLLSDTSQHLVLKLVSSNRKHPSVPTEAEKCVALAHKHPAIATDQSLSFPLMIFKCSAAGGVELYDLFVTRETLGTRLSDVLAHHYRSNPDRLDTLVEIFRKFGVYLAGFHATYQMQHGHCHPSNVFYDESSNLFTITDVSKMEANPYSSDDDDVTYFYRALKTLEQYYGAELVKRCGLSVAAGYKTQRAKR